MTEITINKKRYLFSLEADSTVNEVITTILNDARFSDYAITQMDCDGIARDWSDMQLTQTPVSTYTSLNIDLKTSLELAAETLDTLPETIDYIVNQIYLLVDALQANDHQRITAQFKVAIDLTSLYLEVISRVMAAIKKQTHFSNAEITKIRKVELHLLSVLKSLIPAKEKNDFLMLSDLLEYELTDNLLQWKTEIVPLLTAQISH